MRNPTQIDQATQRTVLACKCGELLIVLGGEDEWRSGGPAVFECGACAAKITLPEDEGREPEEVDYRALSLGELIKALKRSQRHEPGQDVPLLRTGNSRS